MDLDKLEVNALLDLMHAAMIRSNTWHASIEGDRFRVTVTRELLGGQPCGCDPKAGYTCQRHQEES